MEQGDIFSTHPYCPYFQATLELVGKRWTAAILRCLLGGERRFSQMAADIPSISARLLTARLRELVEAGMVRVEARGTYVLTERGEDLRMVFLALEAWNDRWAKPRGRLDSGLAPA